MSSWKSGGAVLCAGLLAAGPLAAQDSMAVLRQMEGRLDSLRAIVHAADSLAALQVGSDTVVAGGLRIVTSPVMRPTVELAAAELHRALLARYGEAAVDSGQPTVIQFGTKETAAPSPRRAEEIALTLDRTAVEAIWRKTDTLLSGWLEGHVPWAPLTRPELALLAASLPSVPARPTPACLQGDPVACESMLGLGLGTDTLDAWYPAAAWPGLVERISLPVPGPDTSLRNSCEGQDHPEACRALLRPARIRPPVGPEGRRLLMQLALDHGGAGAFARLTANPSGPLDRRIEAAAGMPLDGLLGEWSDTLRSAMPTGPGPDVAEVLVVLAWSAILLALSIGGSRWR
jgi:hypothetical protein